MKLGWVLGFVAVFAGLAPAQTTDGVFGLPGTVVCPHAAWGGSWTSTLYATNFNGAGSFTFKFYDPAGQPLRVPVSTSTGLSGRVTEITVPVGANGTEFVELSSNDPDTSVGWITATSASTGPGWRAQVYEVFRQTVPGRTPLEAFVACTPPAGGGFSRVFVYDHRNGGETGVAVVSPTKALTGHTQIEVGPLTLRCSSNGPAFPDVRINEADLYSVFTLSSKIPATAGKVGSCMIGGIYGFYAIGPSPVAIHFSAGGAFSTVPVSGSH